MGFGLFLDETFFRQLLQRRGIVELFRVRSFGFRISRRDVFHDRFHFWKRDRRHIANITEHVAFEGARQQLCVRVARILSQNANGKIGVGFCVLNSFKRCLQKAIECLRLRMNASVVTSAVPG